ncbi:MAG: DUF3343 domain-containing protein [Oscillospiraceae bacterium]
MAQSMIVLSSITYAYKAQKILEHEWIKSSVVRTPKKYSNRGCGYSLLLSADFSKAIGILQRDRIQVLNAISDYQP